MNKFFTGVIVGILLGILGLSMPRLISNKSNAIIDQDSVIVKLEQPEFFLEEVPTTEAVIQACEYYGIQYPEVVVSQAILETGHYRSDLCIKGNNLFGLYNSRANSYFLFEHWTQSVKAYRDKIQYRYKEGDYYTWLQEIGYAEDPLYILKVKNVKEKYNL